MNSFDLFGNPSTAPTLKEDSHYNSPSYLEPVPETPNAVEEDSKEHRFFPGISIALIVLITALGVQCFRLQVKDAAENKARAEGNSLRVLTTAPDRGLIVDASGTVIAQNTRQLALAINPQSLPTKKADRQTVYNQLKNKAGIAQKEIDFIESNRLQTSEVFPIKTNLTKEESLLYEEEFANVAGVTLQQLPIRHYATNSSYGQILGYVGPVDSEDEKNGFTANQLIGKSGLEKTYNSQLLGTPGRQTVEINASGEVVRPAPNNSDTAAKPGQTLKISIDNHLQDVVATALKNELDRRNAKFGPMPTYGASAVVVDPQTGAIKAMVSLPDYDGNLFAQGISQKDYQGLLNNPGNPLLNRAIQGQYPPGSTIKPLIASAALQDGEITKNFSWTTPYSLDIGSFSFIDWTHAHTAYASNVERAIAESNDVFFYALGGGWKAANLPGLGVDKENQYLKDFGLGSPLGIDIAGESSGLLGDTDYKTKTFNEPWYIGDTYHASIGQGYTLATPLQMAMATAAIANGGTLWQPSIAWSFIDPVTNKESLIPRKVLRDNFISPDNLATVRDGMRETVVTGSARELNGLQVTSAGKTGTAEYGSGENQQHAWYTGFAPYDKPQIAFAITIESGGESFYSSVPVAEEILRGYFNEPLKPGEKLLSATNVPNGYQGEH